MTKTYLLKQYSYLSSFNLLFYSIKCNFFIFFYFFILYLYHIIFNIIKFTYQLNIYLFVIHLITKSSRPRPIKVPITQWKKKSIKWTSLIKWSPLNGAHYEPFGFKPSGPTDQPTKKDSHSPAVIAPLFPD